MYILLSRSETEKIPPQVVGHEKGKNIRIGDIFSYDFYFNLLIKAKKDPVTMIGNWVSIYKGNIERAY